MILFNIIFVIINLLIVFCAYFIITNRIEKKLINKEVLEKIKEEINSLIVKLNETTVKNISLFEDKKKTLDKKMILADKKKAGLDATLFNEIEEKNENSVKESNNKVYSPQKILKKSIRNSEIKERNDVEIDDKIKEMPIIEKASFLFNSGWNLKDIQKKLGISSGELEFIMNIENMKIK